MVGVTRANESSTTCFAAVVPPSARTLSRRRVTRFRKLSSTRLRAALGQHGVDRLPAAVVQRGAGHFGDDGIDEPLQVSSRSEQRLGQFGRRGWVGVEKVCEGSNLAMGQAQRFERLVLFQLRCLHRISMKRGCDSLRQNTCLTRDKRGVGSS